LDLILWRHAQAQDLPIDDAIMERIGKGEDVRIEIDPVQDLARMLTPKGERQAERMGAWLNQRLPESTKVLVSPAQCTQQTALALGRSFKTMRALNPQATVDHVLEAAKWPRSRDAVLIIGHQPTLGTLAARLLTGHGPSARGPCGGSRAVSAMARRR
jgi:phosphohistidine phosphatase